MTTIDRLSDGYQPDFDIDLAVGAQAELFVADIAQMLAVGSGRIEVKADRKVARTGNVYLEYECFRRGKWQRSGIATTKADLWAFVLPANVLIVAPVESVRALAIELLPRYGTECPKGSHPTKGVAVPVGEFVRRLYRFEVAVYPDTG